MPAQTKRQREVLELITRYFETNGYRPSYQQIAKHLGLKSRAGIARIVQELESHGLLERHRENGHFSIEMKGTGDGVSINWLDVPRVHSFAEINREAPIVLPEFMIGTYNSSEISAFRVPDSAMAPEIEMDDIILVELRDFCRDGQAIVAILNETETVLRKHYRVNSEIELHGSNDSAEKIVLAANRVRIAGIYRGLLRPAV